MSRVLISDRMRTKGLEKDHVEIDRCYPPLHPGEILREEFIVPLGLTAGKVAKACGITRSRIERIVAEKIGISGDTALRLGRVFRTTPQFWMNLQSCYELEKARLFIGEEVDRLSPIDALGESIERV